jgi:aminoglycoside/choline kinase family phosphotransferase
MRIPIGLCHGDLTLSNILVQEHQGDRIVLIDFLDSFIESPLADLAKLRQDLVHGWTLQMLRSRDDFIDGVRLYVLHRRLYERVVLAPFAAEPWFAFGFFFFSVVNQLRVLQYSKDAAIATYLMRTIVRDLTDWRAFLLA